MAAARCPDKVKALILEDPVLTLDNYKRTVDASRDMYGLWLDLKKSVQSEKELSLALADKYREYPASPVSGSCSLPDACGSSIPHISRTAL